MKVETKMAIFEGVVSFSMMVGVAAFIHWVGEVNWWVAWAIGAGFANGVDASMKIKANHRLFDVADKELVRVSALANNLEEQLAEVKSQLDELKFATR